MGGQPDSALQAARERQLLEAIQDIPWVPASILNLYLKIVTRRQFRDMYCRALSARLIERARVPSGGRREPPRFGLTGKGAAALGAVYRPAWWRSLLLRTRRLDPAYWLLSILAAQHKALWAMAPFVVGEKAVQRIYDRPLKEPPTTPSKKPRPRGFAVELLTCVQVGEQAYVNVLAAVDPGGIRLEWFRNTILSLQAWRRRPEFKQSPCPYPVVVLVADDATRLMELQALWREIRQAEWDPGPAPTLRLITEYDLSLAASERGPLDRYAWVNERGQTGTFWTGIFPASRPSVRPCPEDTDWWGGPALGEADLRRPSREPLEHGPGMRRRGILRRRKAARPPKGDGQPEGEAEAQADETAVAAAQPAAVGVGPDPETARLVDETVNAGSLPPEGNARRDEAEGQGDQAAGAGALPEEEDVPPDGGPAEPPDWHDESEPAGEAPDPKSKAKRRGPPKITPKEWAAAVDNHQAVTPMEHRLLNLVGLYPLATIADLALVMGRRSTDVAAEIGQLTTRGLVFKPDGGPGYGLAWPGVTLLALRAGLEPVRYARLRQWTVRKGPNGRPELSLDMWLRTRAHTNIILRFMAGLLRSGPANDARLTYWLYLPEMPPDPAGGSARLMPDARGCLALGGVHELAFCLEVDRRWEKGCGVRQKLQVYYDRGAFSAGARGRPDRLLIVVEDADEARLQKLRQHLRDLDETYHTRLRAWVVRRDQLEAGNNHLDPYRAVWRTPWDSQGVAPFSA